MNKNINENQRLSNLLENNRFKEAYEKLLVAKKIELKEEEFILTCILILFGNYFKDKRLKKTYNFAYHLLLLYSIRTENFRPLFDISIQLGLYPITRHILINQLIKEENYKIQDIISGIYIRDTYYNDSYTLTKKQSEANKYLLESQSKSLAYIAPTSFGKSSIIKDIIRTNKYKRICILAPSKSLIQQNFRNFIEFGEHYSIIYHDKMYDNQDKFICIVTQERAMRLLNKINSFDIIFVDEAHNILDFDKSNNLRGLLLSKFLGISKNRNSKTKLLYLSPLVTNTDNLRTIGLEKIDEFIINNNIKSELIYYYRDNTISVYDKYTGNHFAEERTHLKFENYIISNSTKKNFIYNFKPKNIELIAKNISKSLSKVNDKELEEIKNILIKEVHKDFNIVDLIDFGVIYLHAKIPTLIKEFLEEKFNKVHNLKYLIANSVILEGINLPIDSLFITSTTELDSKKLINLVGRVNRLDKVFEEKKLHKLLCNIHFVEEKSLNKNHSLNAGLNRMRIFNEKDLIENPLIENYNIKDLKIKKTETKTKDERISERIILDNNLRTSFNLLLSKNINNQIEKYLLNNNFEEIYSSENIPIIAKILEKSFSRKLNYTHIVDYIFNYIIKETSTYISNESVKRLVHEPTRDYYKYYLDEIRVVPYKTAINLTYNFFEKKSKSNDPLLYFGSTYGEVTRENSEYKSFKKVYVNLSDSKYQYKDLINLAIVKLKIEEDFISYELNKLVNLLFDFNVITEKDFNIFTYGTNDNKYLTYLYLGINISTIKKLIDDSQLNNLKISKTSLLIPNSKFNDYLKNQSELFQFEINKYIQL